MDAHREADSRVWFRFTFVSIAKLRHRTRHVRSVPSPSILFSDVLSVFSSGRIFSRTVVVFFLCCSRAIKQFHLLFMSQELSSTFFIRKFTQDLQQDSTQGSQGDELHRRGRRMRTLPRKGSFLHSRPLIAFWVYLVQT